MEHFPGIKKVHFEQAKKEENWKEREYVLDKTLVNPEDSLQKHLHLHKHEGEEKADSLIKQLAEEFERKLREVLAKKDDS